MFTDSFLEFLCGSSRVKLTVFLESYNEAAAERIEYEPIGYRMHEATGDSSGTGERLQSVSGHGEAQRQRLACPALAKREELLDIQIARSGTKQFAEFARHCGTKITLDDDVSSRTDSCKGADDRLAR